MTSECCLKPAHAPIGIYECCSWCDRWCKRIVQPRIRKCCLEKGIQQLVQQCSNSGDCDPFLSSHAEHQCDIHQWFHHLYEVLHYGDFAIIWHQISLVYLQQCIQHKVAAAVTESSPSCVVLKIPLSWQSWYIPDKKELFMVKVFLFLSQQIAQFR